jgi:hypothetical protein
MFQCVREPVRCFTLNKDLNSYTFYRIPWMGDSRVARRKTTDTEDKDIRIYLRSGFGPLLRC